MRPLAWILVLAGVASLAGCSALPTAPHATISGVGPSAAALSAPATAASPAAPSRAPSAIAGHVLNAPAAPLANGDPIPDLNGDWVIVPVTLDGQDARLSARYFISREFTLATLRFWPVDPIHGSGQGFPVDPVREYPGDPVRLVPPDPLWPGDPILPGQPIFPTDPVLWQWPNDPIRGRGLIAYPVDPKFGDLVLDLSTVQGSILDSQRTFQFALTIFDTEGGAHTLASASGGGP